jgi:hypothetical protein
MLSAGMSPCGSCRNRHFGGKFRFNLHGENNQQTKIRAMVASYC